MHLCKNLRHQFNDIVLHYAVAIVKPSQHLTLVLFVYSEMSACVYDYE